MLAAAGAWAAWDSSTQLGATPLALPQGGPAFAGNISADGGGSVQDHIDGLTSPAGGGMMGYDQEEAYASGTIGAALKRFIIITDAPYNADPTGAVSASPAFQRAIEDAGGAPCEIVAKGSTFLFDASVECKSNCTIRGDGSTEFRAPGNMTMFVADDQEKLKFKDISFASSTNSPLTVTGAVRARNCNSVSFIRCRFNRVIIHVWSTKPRKSRDFKVLGCEVEGDYTNSLAPDVVNVFDIRGIESVLINGSSFTATNYYRLFKISTAVIGGDPYKPAYSSSKVSITSNVMDTGGTGVQQIIDLSFNTREVTISGNMIHVSGPKVPYIIHAKSANSDARAATPDNITISGNTIIADAGVQCAIYMESNWGVPGWSGNTRLTVAGNTITAIDGIAGLLQIKGFNLVNVSSNTTDQGAISYGRSITIVNCQAARIDGNVIGCGSIEIAGGGSTQDGANYANSPESIMICGNTVNDFHSNGGINIYNCTALEELTIADNHIRNQTDDAAIIGAVYISKVAASQANVHDNTVNCANSAKNYIIKSSTIFKAKRERGNSWNSISLVHDFGSIASGDVGNLVGITLNGAEMGDDLRVNADVDLSGLMVSAYQSSPQVAVILLYNPTGSPINLGSATWRLTYGRGG